MANQIDTTLQFHAQALNLRAQRQQLLASNIANADTPGYKARDMDFRKAMHDALAAGASGNATASGAPLARTAQAHLAAPAGADAPFGPVLYRTEVQPSLDGNTVDMDVERAQFAENAIHYEASLMFLNGQIKSLLSAIQG
jgi:flagellar basal-body rod protein FlgB